MSWQEVIWFDWGPQSCLGFIAGFGSSTPSTLSQTSAASATAERWEEVVEDLGGDPGILQGESPAGTQDAPRTGKGWVVTVIPVAGRHSFSGGWRSSVVDNRLKEGDACIFELVKRTEM
ncbi:hypothetical protein C3L33_23289, partial [Rhododendron williamsianum]